MTDSIRWVLSPFVPTVSWLEQGRPYFVCARSKNVSFCVFCLRLLWRSWRCFCSYGGLWTVRVPYLRIATYRTRIIRIAQSYTSLLICEFWLLTNPLFKISYISNRSKIFVIEITFFRRLKASTSSKCHRDTGKSDKQYILELFQVGTRIVYTLVAVFVLIFSPHLATRCP